MALAYYICCGNVIVSLASQCYIELDQDKKEEVQKVKYCHMHVQINCMVSHSFPCEFKH
jgi:hypothetical protein